MYEEEHPEEAPEITPQVLHLRDLLKWVRQGRVRVPNFQRDFTWNRPRMLDLFDSIRKQYPIGTLLFWESRKPRPMSQVLGPLRLSTAPGGGQLLVLDGQQRLTTLAGVLLLDELGGALNEDRDPGRWKIYYDAQEDSFVHLDDIDDPPLFAVRVAKLMGTRGLFEVAQRIMSSDNSDSERGFDEDTRSEWVERIEAVSAALAAYRVPLVVFATDSLRLAVESFARLNRSGQKIGPDELFSALTYDAEGGQEAFRLATHIDSILSEIVRTGFGEIDRVVVLRSVLLAAKLDPFSTKWDQLAEHTRQDAGKRLPSAIQIARRGLVEAVKFLRTEGVWNSRLLPYGAQLVGLAAFFGSLESAPTEAQRSLLRRWFWVSAFTEGFGGWNPSRIHVQLKALRDDIPRNMTPSKVEGIDLDAPAHSFPERHDHRSARLRALLCVMLQNPLLGPDGTEIEPERMAADVLERGPQALIRVCARVPAIEGSPALQSSPANRVFAVDRNHRGQAKNWLINLNATGRDRVLHSHHISDAAWAALEEGDHRAFVERRIETLVALEREFMQQKGVVPPKSDSPARSAIDVEEDAPFSDDADIEDP